MSNSVTDLPNRYDLMQNSVVKDIDNQNFPDPLSVNYNEFAMSSSPYRKKLDSRHLIRPWTLLYSMYSINYYDDIVMNLNGIDLRSSLDASDDLFVPTREDLDNFYAATKLKNGRSD